MLLNKVIRQLIPIIIKSRGFKLNKAFISPGNTIQTLIQVVYISFVKKDMLKSKVRTLNSSQTKTGFLFDLTFAYYDIK